MDGGFLRFSLVQLRMLARRRCVNVRRSRYEALEGDAAHCIAATS
jgi:hypothetical protein